MRYWITGRKENLQLSICGKRKFKWFYTTRRAMKLIERIKKMVWDINLTVKREEHQDPRLPYPLDISWEGVADVSSAKPEMQNCL